MAAEQRRRRRVGGGGGGGGSDGVRDRPPRGERVAGAARGPERRVVGPARAAAAAAALLSVLWLALWLAPGEWRRREAAARLASPHPAPPARTPHVPHDRLWGTYRPNVYFGMKTRSPRSPVTGLMWLQQGGGGGLRHTCEQSDGLSRYGWRQHDGHSFGRQDIQDGNLWLTTEFVKRPGGEHGGDWSWRITARNKGSGGSTPLLSLFFYVATDGQGTLEPQLENGTRLSAVTGSTEELGRFTITFLRPTGGNQDPKFASYNHLDSPSPGLHRLSDLVRSSLRGRFIFAPPGSPRRRFFGVDAPGSPPDRASHGRLLLHQVTLEPPATLEVVFESGSVRDRAERLSGPVLSRALERHSAAFERRFEETFGLGRKGFSSPERRFAQAALSEMLGGVGFFHGRSLLRSALQEEPVPGPEASLLTAVPSRSFFPRGFLWDEGFHQLLLWRWDAALSREVLAHWLDLLSAEGWIPREQILGEEARAKVPPEFVLQDPETANPPTLLLALEAMLPTAPEPFVRRLFPRLRAWFDWFLRTQAGPVPHSFRWRGRDADHRRFLNPKTLASGLDDYPRASHPSPDERHLDLRCWMALAARVLAAVAERLGEPAEDLRETERTLSDGDLLDRLHWAPELGAFADWGNHSVAVELRPRPAPRPAPGQPPAPPQLLREVREAPRPRFVEALGYVSLFPLLLQLLAPASPRLPKVLDALRSERQLWSPFGLRSLSRDSRFYGRRNTADDPPYWRGDVWVNVNYLALRALRGYGQAEGPQRERAAQIYRELRHNLISNVFRQYERSGFLWEHYGDGDGRGRGCHPFAGWSALVVLVMAEDY